MRFELTLTGLTNRGTAIVLQPPLTGLGGRIRTAITGFGDQRNAIILHRDILERVVGFEPIY